MASLAFAPHQPSPLARTTSPFKDPRTPPRTPRNPTAKIWDEYERRALENARRRDTASAASSPSTQPLSSGTVLGIIGTYDPPSSSSTLASPSVSAAASPRFDLSISSSSHILHATTVASCKTCNQSIMSTSGICEKCKKTIVLPFTPGESTPPLSPSCRNFASTDLSKLHKASAAGTTTPTSTSPKRKSRRSSSTQFSGPSIRLSSFKPTRTHDNKVSIDPPRPRKTSLIDPNEPFMRLYISRKPVPLSQPHPSSPTTPPATSHSYASASASDSRTRPSSFANIIPPPQYAGYPRHDSATPSELSTLAPFMSDVITPSPSSVFRASYNLHNTVSAWDEWDSDEEEKAGVVGYWRGRKWRGSRGSLGATSARRESAEKEESVKEEAKRKRMGFVRVISCGCGQDE